MSGAVRRTMIGAIAAAASALLACTAECAPEAFGDPELAAMLSLAEANAPSIKGAEARVRGAEAEARGARAKRQPRVYAAAGAFWNKDDPGAFAISPATGMPIGIVPMAYRNTYAAALAFEQVIWAGGSLSSGAHAAELAADAARAQASRVYQGVLAATRDAYFGARRAAARLDVADQALELSREHLAQAQALHDAGVAPMGDVMRVKVAVSQAELDRISASNALDMALVALERLTGEPAAREQFLSSRGAAQSVRPPEYMLQGDPVEIALSDRAELKSAELQRARAEQLLRAANGQRLPTVFLAGEALALGDSFPPQEKDSWHLQLGMTWTLYDGGEIRSRELQAAAAMREIEHAADDLRGEVRQETIQAMLDLESARARLDVALDQVATAEEDYRIALRRYDAQVGTNIDVLDARVALTQSRTQYVDAVYDIAAAQSGLIYATGGDAPPEGLF